MTASIKAWHKALPFWLSFALVPLVGVAAWFGGWALILPPLGTWWLFIVLDALAGENDENADPKTAESDLFWYKLITLFWFPLQFVAIFGTLWFIASTDHLARWEAIVLFFNVGILSGTIGITYAHELIHQRSQLERWCGDLLLALVLYSHFRSEHLLVHHVFVGTPRDPVTARYNEGFYRFFSRVLPSCFRSAWRAESAVLATRRRAVWHRANPFWRFAALQGAALILALVIGGWTGLGLFLVQAITAIWQLELINYIEHYGLTRKHLGGGRYESVLPRHSWNATAKASNWLLINLQRHSDHHFKPNRRFPLLQTYDPDEAPHLPFGYPVMAIAALVPPVWRRLMNPRVRAWRKRFYPEIDDWTPYKLGTLPAAA
ncbi:MAG: alkane 1-monooxygenase [Pseudomonadota bacterium]